MSESADAKGTDFRSTEPAAGPPQTRVPEADPAAPGDDAATFHPLDPRVVDLWRLIYLIRTAFFLVILLVAALVAWGAFEMSLLWVAAGWTSAAALFLLLSLWLPPRVYRAWGYHLDERVLEVKSGLVFHVVQLLPLARLQHVDLHRGPLERTFGLASLVLHTAGTREASIVVPGLDARQAAQLRDHLVELGADRGV